MGQKKRWGACVLEIGAGAASLMQVKNGATEEAPSTVKSWTLLTSAGAAVGTDCYVEDIEDAFGSQLDRGAALGNVPHVAFVNTENTGKVVPLRSRGCDALIAHDGKPFGVRIKNASGGAVTYLLLVEFADSFMGQG